MQYAEVDLQQLQLRLRHEPPEAQAAIEAEYQEQASSKIALRPLHLEPTPSSISTLPQDLYRFNNRRFVPLVVEALKACHSIACHSGLTRGRLLMLDDLLRKL